jgi:hypothetical protein
VTSGCGIIAPLLLGSVDGVPDPTAVAAFVVQDAATRTATAPAIQLTHLLVFVWFLTAAPSSSTEDRCLESALRMRRGR